jgi:hypothetical protein
MQQKMGASWAIVVDTDGRVNLDGIDLHESMAGMTCDVLTVPHIDGMYTKPRIFRLPARGVWIGQTREYFDR